MNDTTQTPTDQPSELDAIRARVDEIEHLHTRADLHLISEILKAAGYTCEIRDDEEWWSNGGVWSSQADAYGMLQFEDMLEVAKLCRRLIALVEERDDAYSELIAERNSLRDDFYEHEKTNESLRRELAEAKRLLDERDGALKAQDDRELTAAQQAGILYVGCDTPDALAEAVTSLRRELAEAREKIAEMRQEFLDDFSGGIICKRVREEGVYTVGNYYFPGKALDEEYDIISIIDRHFPLLFVP